MMRKGLVAALVLGLGLVAAGPAAASTMYTSKSAFQSATSGLTTVDFNGIAAPGSFVFFGTGPLNLSGVTFTGNNQMFVIDPGYYGSPYPDGGFLNSDYSSTNTIVVSNLPAGTTAVGVDFGGLFTGGATFSITLSTGETFVASTPGSIEDGFLGFVGFTSSTPITSIQFDMPDAPGYNALDNFVFGSAQAAVPEPASLTLLGLGAFGLAGFTLRRRKKG